jgi:hypothetical protein
MIPTQASPESPILSADGSWDAWLASPPGQYVLRQEQLWFDKTVVDVFGFNAVQIGLPQLHCLRENRMPMRALLTHADQSLGTQSNLPITPTWHIIEGPLQQRAWIYWYCRMYWSLRMIPITFCARPIAS